ncbi:hypothetical protein JCM16161A_02250 [Vulcanisaeta sp. JCM 16161]|uniref:hypothetical protein n=1 Tax=Vulcanisaeta sp. JCM 16161 TaxID=1295372 RepID=UPI0006D1C48B|nr:hypothetical protein [Vulcanisaeta sp. JCM 16161]
MELYGARAWLLVGIAVLGWVLAIIGLASSLANYNIAMYYRTTTIFCISQYNALARNYTTLANRTLGIIEWLGNATLINAYALNQTGQVITSLNQTLVVNNELMNQVAWELRAVNQTLNEDNALLRALIMAVNSTNSTR